MALPTEPHRVGFAVTTGVADGAENPEQFDSVGEPNPKRSANPSNRDDEGSVGNCGTFSDDSGNKIFMSISNPEGRFSTYEVGCALVGIEEESELGDARSVQEPTLRLVVGESGGSLLDIACSHFPRHSLEMFPFLPLRFRLRKTGAGMVDPTDWCSASIDPASGGGEQVLGNVKSPKRCECDL